MEWNDERTAALKKMWLEGMSASQVARQLGGVSRNAVIGKVHRLGLNTRDTPSRPRSLGGRPPGSGRPRAALGLAQRVANATPQRAAPAVTAAPLASTSVPAPAFSLETGPTATLLTLKTHACRWPIGDPAETGFGFCGRERAGAGSYCADHSSLAVRRKRGEAAISAEIDYWVKQSTAPRRESAQISAR
ncbi:MAG: GcrA family cell cycle regulator [Caulobacteraceae bacterium]|nr:GcrA family cell cycle regulator [Caulobacteraceae bacterium]